MVQYLTISLLAIASASPVPKPEQGLSADSCPTALWATVLGNIIANPDETTNVGSVFSMFYPCKTSCGMESFAIEAMQSIVEAVEVERGVRNEQLTNLHCHCIQCLKNIPEKQYWQQPTQLDELREIEWDTCSQDLCKQ